MEKIIPCEDGGGVNRASGTTADDLLDDDNGRDGDRMSDLGSTERRADDDEMSDLGWTG